MTFLKYSILLSTTLIFKFHDCLAMKEDNEKGLKKTVVHDLRKSNKTPDYQSGKFKLEKTNYENKEKIYYTDFFTGVNGIVQARSIEEKSLSLNSFNVEITKDKRCQIVQSDQTPNSLPEKVVYRVNPGKDGRKQVINTTDLPYRFHGHLLMTFVNGKKYTGSGTLVGPHHVLTAGHNIFSHAQGEGWATSVTFIPARNEDNQPYGEASGSLLLSTEDWTIDQNKDYDFGMVVLNNPLGHKAGWAGLFSSSDNALKKKIIHVSGYPGDKGKKDKIATQLWTMSHTFKSIHKETLNYDIDTYPGQSGSGVWTKLDGGYYVVGVHAYGERDDKESEGNSATRLSTTKINRLVSWMKNYQLQGVIPNDITDLQLSKESFLISGAPYNIRDIEQGVMTLCFKKEETQELFSYDHASLVFEMFFPNKTSTEVSAHMIYYGSGEVCCGVEDKKPFIENQEYTLQKVYRTTKETTFDIKSYHNPAYARYASWIVPNVKLREACKIVVKDSEDIKCCNSYNSFTYVKKIMESVGFTNIDFGLWATAKKLKFLVDNHIQPKPKYIENNFAKNNFN